MLKIVVIVFLSITILSCSSDKKKVCLRGELKNFGTEVFMSKETPEGVLLKDGITIKPDTNNQFEISFKLDQPAYFRLGRNTLYLSPGDYIDMECDFKDPMTAKFSGKGADACFYLRAKPFPKAGSFLEAGDMIKDDPNLSTVLKRLKKKTEKRLHELKEIQNISFKFKKMEEGRIRFGAVNTLLSYPGYASWIKKLDDEGAKQLANKSEIYFQNDISDYLVGGGDADYLHLDVYRDICSSCVELIGAENVDQKVQDYIKTKKLLNQLFKQGPVAEVKKQKAKTIDQLKSDEYKNIVHKAFGKYDVLLSGKTAPDFGFKNTNGEDLKLSDFKGKMLVIDIWATWCGPCIKESPYFEKLAQKYKDQNVEFIAISIDSNQAAWEKYLEKHSKKSMQCITNRTEFSAYRIHGIPRFIVIDKNGLIVDAFASRPSDPNLEELLKRHL